MAVPKKKKSVSRKKIRQNSVIYNQKYFLKCKDCDNFILSHRKCICNFKDTPTNLAKKYN